MRSIPAEFGRRNGQRRRNVPRGWGAGDDSHSGRGGAPKRSVAAHGGGVERGLLQVAPIGGWPGLFDRAPGVTRQRLFLAVLLEVLRDRFARDEVPLGVVRGKPLSRRRR